MATIRICNVEGCQRKHYGHGLCQMHYNATPARRAAQVRYKAEAKEREQGLSSATTAPTLVPVPDIPQSALETRQ